MRTHLGRRKVGEVDADRVIAELLEDAYLDDARYARRFAEDRRELDGWGAERIARSLRDRGVDRDLVDAALAEHAGGELEAALALLRRRFPGALEDPRERQRALGVLVRRGYELELAHDALRAHDRAATHAAGVSSP